MDKTDTIVNQPTSYPANPPPYPGPPLHYPPPGMPPPGIPPPGVHGSVIVGTAVIPVTMVPQMGSSPVTITCASCNHRIVTRVEFAPNTKTHIFAALLCLFTCWPCVCLPYCIPSCNSSNHYCPNCDSYIGTYQP